MGMAQVDRLLVEAAEHYTAGRPQPASALCADILAAQPDHLPALHLAAVIALAEGRMDDGRALLGRVFHLDPDHVPALATLGDALAVKGEHDGAVAVFQRAVALRPLDADLYGKLGVALSELSRFAEAEAAYRRALALDPDLIQARFNLATALAGQARPTEAEQIYRAVIERDPHHGGAWINLGNLLADQNRPTEAAAAYRKALEDWAPEDESRNRDWRAPVRGRDAATALANLAGCLCELGQLDEAMEACDRALSLDANHAPSLTNLGMILDAQGKFEEAVNAHKRAVAADPAYARGHANLAVALRITGALDEALAASHQAVALHPDDPLIRFNHAHALLMNGHLASGFEELRWGQSCRGWSEGYPDFAEPEWRGEAFTGRTLLLYAEAGLGDTLQFVRYLPMVAERGGSIVLQVQPSLVPLLHTMPGVTVIARGEPLPQFDLHLPLIGLPRVFGTTLDTIPARIPYLRPQSAKMSLWRRVLGNETSLKVGVVWAGNPRHKGDRLRSLAAKTLLPQLVMQGVKLHCLQKDVRAADAPAVAAISRDIVDLAPALGDFSDTAAAITALDLVITVDTSVAHLAGALGRPVWLLLPYALDWRWLRDREDTPWYPGMRLFRQRRPRIWDDVIARVSAELARLVGGERDLLWPPGSDFATGGRLVEAEETDRQAAGSDPDDARLHGILGAALHQQGKLNEALVHYGRAKELAPHDTAALRQFGLALHKAGRTADAVEIYRRVIVVDPADVTIHNNLCGGLCDLGRFDEAATACEQALALEPGYAKAHVNRGLIFEQRNDIDAAIAAYRRAIAADPSNADGHSNLAVVLHKTGEIDEALAVSHRAVALAPEHPLIHSNRAAILLDNGDIDEALATSHRAVALAPENPLVRFNHSHLLLMCGDLRNGFADYRWRRRYVALFETMPDFGVPEWQGESFPGRTLLLFSEQGIGDVLQFVRYLPMVAARGGTIILHVQATLVPLLRQLQGVTVVARGAALPPLDLQLPLMDLPHVFGTTVDSIPSDVPYLRADPIKARDWRRTFRDTAALKVGIVWAGSPTHKHDRSRSLAAESVLPRLVMPGVQLYSLQKELRPAVAPVLARLGSDVIDLAPGLGDFADTAAAVAALDLVIAVDTSVAHLAGAMGRPVWVLLPYALDWRWLRDREDTPWYPGMRLFRQRTPRAWEDVIARVSAELAGVIGGRRDLLRPPRQDR